MPCRIDSTQDALIVVDVQKDFCPRGALAVPEGDQVVPVINRLLSRPWRIRVATRDWHPPNHCSFEAQGGHWPVHCVADTPGAAFHPDLDASRVDWVISKATAPEAEAYSAFQGSDLVAARLRAQGVTRVFVCGLATDYCVKQTALDAKQAGFETVVLEDAARGVEVNPGDTAKALDELRAAGVEILQSAVLAWP